MNDLIKDIHIILRTHDGGNVHNDWRVRYCDMDKNTLIKGCFKSLKNSIKDVRAHNVRLTILDDHSSDDLINFLKEEIKDMNAELIHLEEKGYRHSALVQFQMCRDSKADLVYSVEDDYLHQTSAIREMIDSFYLFEQKLDRSDIVLYPFDTPEEYDPPEAMCWLVHGTERHWRSGIYTTNVMMTTPELFKANWILFETLAKNYDGNYLRKEEPGEIRVWEDNTIWNIWRANRAIRFNPVPSLALHMQFDRQLDPFIKWRKWWDEYAN